jgi:hypothetical protein
MKRAAMPICNSTKLAIIAALLGAAPLAAQEEDEPEVVTGGPNAEDVAMTPLTDLNLAKDEIPPLLLDSLAYPYSSEGLTSCESIGDEIAKFDAVLGEDLDIAPEERERLSIARIGRSVVGSFIPFRSVIREVTGAADHRRRFEDAILAGAIRRGYLKGLGEQKGCDYPARPAVRMVISGEDYDKVRQQRDKQEKTPGGTPYVSEPVIQPTGG